ncbi:MAG: ASCH domain-containing protein [Pikeienuella sp.]
MTDNSKLTKALRTYPNAQCFRFGDTEALCNELLALVRSGKKAATCGKLIDYESGMEAKPEIGRIDIALEWDGTPAVALQTTELKLCLFNQVEEDFALAEGEDETLESWQESHQRYYARTTGFEPEMMLVCERFRVIQDFQTSK